MKNDCFSFIKFCNERIANSNDYNIARTIINHIEDIKILSLEKIAEEANISPASVSRSIKLVLNPFRLLNMNLSCLLGMLKCAELFLILKDLCGRRLKI